MTTKTNEWSVHGPQSSFHRNTDLLRICVDVYFMFTSIHDGNARNFDSIHLRKRDDFILMYSVVSEAGCNYHTEHLKDCEA